MNYIHTLAVALSVSATSLLMGCMGAPDSSEPNLGEAASPVVYHCVASPPGLPGDQHSGFGFSVSEAVTNALRDCADKHDGAICNAGLCHINHG